MLRRVLWTDSWLTICRASKDITEEEVPSEESGSHGTKAKGKQIFTHTQGQSTVLSSLGLQTNTELGLEGQKATEAASELFQEILQARVRKSHTHRLSGHEERLNWTLGRASQEYLKMRSPVERKRVCLFKKRRKINDREHPQEGPRRWDQGLRLKGQPPGNKV